ncbi:MAG TPA: hypothetical protein VF752_01715 [Thermoleophilaceae bacterium]
MWGYPQRRSRAQTAGDVHEEGRWSHDSGARSGWRPRCRPSRRPYYRSRLDIGLSQGGRADCEDLRAGCAQLVTDDGEPADYSYLAAALTPDGR